MPTQQRRPSATQNKEVKKLPPYPPKIPSCYWSFRLTLAFLYILHKIRKHLGERRNYKDNVANWLGTAIVTDGDNHCQCFRKQWGVQPAIFYKVAYHWASHVVLVAEDIRNAGSVPRSGRSPGGGHGNPLQCSWVENPMDRGAWWAADLRVAQSQTWLKWLSMHAVYS